MWYTVIIHSMMRPMHPVTRKDTRMARSLLEPDRHLYTIKSCCSFLDISLCFNVSSAGAKKISFRINFSTASSDSSPLFYKVCQRVETRESALHVSSTEWQENWTYSTELLFYLLNQTVFQNRIRRYNLLNLGRLCLSSMVIWQYTVSNKHTAKAKCSQVSPSTLFFNH